MTPHEEQYPQLSEPDNGNWGIAHIVLGVVALVIVGTMLLTGA